MNRRYIKYSQYERYANLKKKEHFLLVFIISKENMHLDSKAPFDVI